MRTTLSLDADVAQRLQDEQRRQQKPMKQIVNEALRRGLATDRPKLPRYRVRPHTTTLLGGIDTSGFNRLADELETETAVGKLGTER